MKKLFIFIVLVLFFITSGITFAVPWISTPSTTTEITSYSLIIDGAVPIPILVHTNQDGSFMFAFDIGTLDTPLSNGNHNLTVQGFNTLWGIQTNVFPFDVNKPGSLENISNVEVTATDPRQ